MLGDGNAIVKVIRTKERFCNICGRHTREKCQVNEIVLGRNNQSLSVVMCDKCLDKFADVLWGYLEQRK